jgi:GNAT superfamily N-acetyltransferase
VRRPIPPARRSADTPAAAGTDLAEQHLVDGWQLDDQVRVRLARAEDMPMVRDLVALAGVNLEPEVTAAVATGVAAGALRAAVGSRDAFVRHLADQFFAAQGGDPSMPFQHVTLVLVADHDDQGVVGAAVAYPPLGVIQQAVQYLQRTGADQQQVTQLVCSAAMTIVRIKAIAVTDTMRGRGIGGELLHRCWQVFDHAGYLIVYGQTQDTPQLERFYRRHDFDVLPAGTGYDPWVAFGVHMEVRSDPGERTFIRHRPSRSERQRRRPVPTPRRGTARVDPGTLQLHDALLPYLLETASGDLLAVQLLPLLWIKMAEGQRANACLDACTTLRHAYQQYGITAEIVPTGLVVHDTDGQATQYATDRPRWTTDTEFVGHAVLLLPELDKLVDPTIEQLPPVRELGLGPVIGHLPAEGRHALRHGGGSAGVSREGLLIEYVPVHPDHRDVVTDAPTMLTNAARHRQAGINLAALTLDLLRAEGVVERVRQAPFPVLHALLDAVGDAPIEPDGAGDVRITLPDGAGGTVGLRLDELPSAR